MHKEWLISGGVIMALMTLINTYNTGFHSMLFAGCTPAVKETTACGWARKRHSA